MDWHLPSFQFARTCIDEKGALVCRGIGMAAAATHTAARKDAEAARQTTRAARAAQVMRAHKM